MSTKTANNKYSKSVRRLKKDEPTMMALAVLEEISKSIPQNERPKSLKELWSIHAPYAVLLKEGMKNGIITRQELVLRGILQPTKTEISKQFKGNWSKSIRRANIDELMRLYRLESKLPNFIGPHRESRFLPHGVIGFDFDNKVELREVCFIVVGNDHLVEGESVVVRKQGPSIRIYRSNGTDFVFDYDEGIRWLPERLTKNTESKLKKYSESKVTETKTIYCINVAVVTYKYLTPVSINTLLYALREAGTIAAEVLSELIDWKVRYGFEYAEWCFARQHAHELANAVDEHRAWLESVYSPNQSEDEDVSKSICMIKEYYDGKVRPNSLAQLKKECSIYRDCEEKVARCAKRNRTTVITMLKDCEVLSIISNPGRYARPDRNSMNAWHEENPSESFEELKDRYPNSAALKFILNIDSEYSSSIRLETDKLEALRVGDALLCEYIGRGFFRGAFAQYGAVVYFDSQLMKLASAERIRFHDYKGDDLALMADDPIGMGLMDGTIHLRVAELRGSNNRFHVRLDCYVVFDEQVYQSKQ